MSNFSAGALFLQTYVEEMEKRLLEVDVELAMQPVNDKWYALLMEDLFLELPLTLEALLKISRTIPLLYFYQAEDEGWGYRILHEGRETGCFKVNFNLDTELALDLIAERFPGVDPFFDLEAEVWEGVLNEVKEQEQYRNRLSQQIETKQVQAFALFELADDTIQVLDKLLSVKMLEDFHASWEGVEQFKKLLGIAEFISIDYMHMGELDEDDVDLQEFYRLTGLGNDLAEHADSDDLLDEEDEWDDDGDDWEREAVIDKGKWKDKDDWFYDDDDDDNDDDDNDDDWDDDNWDDDDWDDDWDDDDDGDDEGKGKKRKDDDDDWDDDDWDDDWDDEEDEEDDDWDDDDDDKPGRR